MSLEERKELAKAYVDAAKKIGGVKIIIHVGV